MQTKTCSRCKETKPVSEFGKHRITKDGLAYECKACKSEKDRIYRQNNKEKIAEYKRRHYEANKGRIAERSRKYYADNKERLAKQKRIYQENNKERIEERRRRWYQDNKNQCSREYRKRRKEVNKRSLEIANRHRFPWEDWEDEFVMADNGLTEYQKAVKLGRSYSSVRGRKAYLRKKSTNELTHDKVRV